MPNFKTLQKLSLVSILSHKENGNLYLYYRDSHARKNKYTACRTRSIQEARRQAKALLMELLSPTTKVVDEFEHVLIPKALGMAIQRSTSTNEKHIKNMLIIAKAFTAWMQAKYPEVQHWHLVKSVHVERWVDSMVANKLAYATLKHNVGVVVRTAKYWNNVDSDHYQAFTVIHPGMGNKCKANKNYLTMPQLMALITFAVKAKEHEMFAVFILGGLCGMNILEVTDRKVKDFDFEKNTLRIYDSKTRYRERTIPLPMVVVGLLKTYLKQRKYESPLLLPYERTQKPIGDSFVRKGLTRVRDGVIDTLNSKIEQEADEKKRNAILADIAAYKSITPRDLRKTFTNLASAARVPEAFLEAYIGHSPQTMLGKHYIDREDVERLREEVVQLMFPSTDKTPAIPSV